MRSIAPLQAALSSPRLRAFQRALRLGEGTADDLGYQRLVGGGEFEGFEQHPQKRVWLPKLRVYSDAAGAYQFMSRTWRGLVEQYGFQDFSPATQDLACVALIVGRRALDDVLAGNLQEAVRKCRLEWASLPGSPYGQRTETMERFSAEYHKWLAIFEHGPELADPVPLPENVALAPDLQVQQALQEPASPLSDIELPAIAAALTPSQEKPVAPLLLALLPTLLAKAPELIKIFQNKDASVPDRNVEAAAKVFEIAKEVTGGRNEQEAVQVLEQDQVAAESFRGKVQERWYELVGEVGGGIQAARESSERMANGAVPPWRQPAIWVTCAILPLVYLVVVAVLFRDGWSEEIRATVVTAVITGVLGAVTGFWLGTSYGSQRKTDILAQK